MNNSKLFEPACREDQNTCHIADIKYSIKFLESMVVSLPFRDFKCQKER
jgi:hypothetical protein